MNRHNARRFRPQTTVAQTDADETRRLRSCDFGFCEIAFGSNQNHGVAGFFVDFTEGFGF